MSIRRLIAPTAIATAAIIIALPVATAQAAAPNYHIWNVSASHAPLNIYSGTGCSGTIHILQPGQKATSLGWDSMRMYGVNGVDSVNVRIYDDKTGAFLADRTYNDGQCVNVSDNSHRVQGLL